MSDIVRKFAIAPELARFIDDKFLQVVAEDEAKKTVEFHIPTLRFDDEDGRTTTFMVTWIHPDFNEQFCHFFSEKPGDLANFYVMKITDDLGDEWLDVETFDDLIAWLTDKVERVEFG